MPNKIEPQQNEGIQRYCDSLEEIKIRIKTIQSIVKQEVPIDSFGHENFVDEFIFMQIRKILELIAFGSMLSNSQLYIRTYKNHQKHWKVKDIFKNLENINPDFYPKPLKKSNESHPQTKNVLETVSDGFLTKDDFLSLYDICSGIIHSPKPYQEEKSIDIKMSVDDWIHRIASLLLVHQIKLANTDEWWLVYLIHPEKGTAYAVKAKGIKN